MLAKNCINALQMRFSFVFYTANIEQEIKCLLTPSWQKKLEVARKLLGKHFENYNIMA